MKRNANTMIALLAVLAAVGCENMGLYDAGPAEEARTSPPTPLVAAVIQPTATDNGRELIIDGRLWVASGRPMSLDRQDVRPVGSADGRTVHARAWDRPPYDEVFTATDDERQWLSYRPVIGGDVRPGSNLPSPPGETADTTHDTGAGEH